MIATYSLVFLKVTALFSLCLFTLDRTQASFTLSPLVLEASNSTCPSQTIRDATRNSLRDSVTGALSGVNFSLPQCGPGAWHRITSSDYRVSMVCPEPWVFDLEIVGCTSPSVLGTCSIVSFPTAGVTYNKICGRVTGRFRGTPDSFTYFSIGNTSLVTENDNYVDGVTINANLGQGQLEHVWSFAGAFNSDTCPCAGTQTLRVPPDIVGTNYFCEEYIFNMVLEVELWDGLDCVDPPNCCTFNSPPYFNTTLSSSTNLPLEVSICRDQDVADENVLVTLLELYVQ